MGVFLIFVLVLIALAAGILVYGISLYNALIRAGQTVREAWSGIDVQLKRRAELIPNLVETVKGYASHEKTTLDEVTQARTAALNARQGDMSDRAAAEGKFGMAIANLFAVAEAYPDLKASDSFRDLQASLNDIEDDIQHARRYYNGAVRDMNTRVLTFPSNLIANGFGFHQAEYFELEDVAQRELPKVSF